jgi:chaperone BCS1
LKDVERYHHSSTWLFYARRGIPYRRGYLLYGPPGTGKTSFPLALAGHFQIDLYMTGLTLLTLTDEALAVLFDRLPPKCIVLLEDIDSAGIDREDLEPADSSKPEGEEKMKKRKSSVTLSVLLNTIDGAASQEGRLLIMTSNTPETLDPALIRHGRVDQQIEFEYISRHNAKQLFIRMSSMYGDERADATVPPDSEKEDHYEVPHAVPDMQDEDLEKLADEISSKLPEKMISGGSARIPSGPS